MERGEFFPPPLPPPVPTQRLEALEPTPAPIDVSKMRSIRQSNKVVSFPPSKMRMTVDFEPDTVYKDIEDSLQRMQIKLGINKKRDSRSFQKERDTITKELQEVRDPHQSSYGVSPIRNRRLT